MISNRPYLLRAFYQWISDSNCTPILVVDANHAGCKIPHEYVEGGEIVFNISESAIRDLKITNQVIEFKASFSGIIYIISAPIGAILAIYAEENGEGLFFDSDEEGGEGEIVNQDAIPFKTIDTYSNNVTQENDNSDLHIPKTERGKPFLKLVE